MESKFLFFFVSSVCQVSIQTTPWCDIVMPPFVKPTLRERSAVGLTIATQKHWAAHRLKIVEMIILQACYLERLGWSKRSNAWVQISAFFMVCIIRLTYSGPHK